MNHFKCFGSLVALLLALLLTVGCSSIKAGNDTISNITNATKVTVPDFEGLLYDDIISDEAYSDFEFVLQYEVSDSVPVGMVISQGIEAGKKIARNKQIVLYVSSGPKPLEVPRLDGLNIQDAKILLTKYGIKYNEIPEASESVPKNTVIVTNPPLGTKISPDTVVDVYVSVGPEMTYCKVGDYLKFTEQAARELIEKDGFTVGEIKYVDDKAAEGTVVAQSVASGELLQKGTAIDISVSTGTPVYEYKLTVKDELLELIFDDEHKDMTLSLVIDGEALETTDEFDANVRNGEFEFNVYSKSLNPTVIVRINFLNGESVDAFKYEIDIKNKTRSLTKNNDLFDYVIGVD